MSRQPDNDSSAERPPTALEQTALGWVVRCERGLTGEEESALAEWLAADPRHREIFNEFGGTWNLMGRAGDELSTAAVESLPKEATVVPFETDVASRRRGRGARGAWWSLAAAAVIAIGVLSWRQGAGQLVAITTEIGGSRQLTLPDGSTVALNTDSSVVPVFAPEERRVRLEKGEAFFQVAKDAARPFVVEAAGVGVRAIGTAFNVRVHPEAIEVVVTEGVVRVTPAAGRGAGLGESAEVIAGQRVFVATSAQRAATPSVAPNLTVASVPSDELQRRLAWQGGRLDFSDTPLGEMVAEFNRYNRHKLVVPDAGLAAMRFGGSFRPDDRAGFVRVLRDTFGIVAEERRDETVLRSAGR
jgi:transmembrane sensor